MICIPESCCVLTSRGYVPADLLDNTLEIISYDGIPHKLESVNKISKSNYYVSKIRSTKIKIPTYFLPDTKLLSGSDFYEVNVLDSDSVSLGVGFDHKIFKVLSFPELIPLFFSIFGFQINRINRILTEEPGLYPQALLQVQLDRRYSTGRFFSGFLGLDKENRRELLRRLTKDYTSKKIKFSRHPEDIFSLWECLWVVSPGLYISMVNKEGFMRVNIDETRDYNKIEYNYLVQIDTGLVEINSKSTTAVINGYVVSI